MQEKRKERGERKGEGDERGMRKERRGPLNMEGGGRRGEGEEIEGMVMRREQKGKSDRRSELRKGKREGERRIQGKLLEHSSTRNSFWGAFKNSNRSLALALASCR
jgi:hypothetical protein